jgi:hypothetical protein
MARAKAIRKHVEQEWAEVASREKAKREQAKIRRQRKLVEKQTEVK